MNLPATPMMIPGGLGVFAVYPSGYPDRFYLPLQPGEAAILSQHRLLNPICDTTYTAQSGRVVIHSDIVGAGVSTVDMQLVVMDLGRLGENDIIPAPEDVVEDVFVKTLQIFGMELPLTRAETKAPQTPNP